MPLAFEWDVRKAKANQRKHRVSFDEACTVFDDPLARIFWDEDHSNGEQREIIVGHSILERLLLVSIQSVKQTEFELSVLVERLGESRKIMKKSSVTESRRRRSADDLRKEYRFDHSKARLSRFAGRARAKCVVVLLAPDVAKVFKNGDSVNDALRALMKAVPRKRSATNSN